MRRIAAACALTALNTSALAATYYVNSATGNDSYTGLKATHALLSTAGPWKTLAQVNRAVVAGDTVYLAAGSVWEETLIPKSQVTYDSDGSGNKPLIRGSRYVGGLTWTKPGSSPIYVADVSSLNAAVIGQLYLNGSRLTRARHPNVGQGAFSGTPAPGSRYLRVATGTPGTTTQLKVETAALPSSDINNATLFVRNNNYALGQYQVTGFDGQVITATPQSTDNYTIDAGWGY